MVFLLFNSYAQDTKVLFLGNSYTYVNDLPTILLKLANSNGHTLVKDQNTPGGYRFKNHASNNTSLNKIKQGGWDYVVLQAQSQEPSWPISQIENEVFPYAKMLCDTIKHYNPCAEILFFDTWGRQNGDQQNCSQWPPVCTFAGMNDRLLAGYYLMAEQNKAAISPIGIAWKQVREDGLMNDISLYSSDGSHPSVYGSYLAACVMYYSLFKEPVQSSFYNGLEEDKALYLQSVANSIFDKNFEYIFEDEYSNNTFIFNRNNYFIYGQSVLANFEYNTSDKEISFINQSVNQTSSKWFFDNEHTSTEDNPVYLFEDGNYNVKLVASNECFSDSVTHPIIITSDISSLNKDDIKIIANKEQIILQGLKAIQKVELYNRQNENCIFSK